MTVKWLVQVFAQSWVLSSAAAKVRYIQCSRLYWQQRIIWWEPIHSSEGPCLIHSMNGDLLRTLDGPDRCTRPRLIQSTSEGSCIIYYDKGHFCLFSVNGKLLGHMEVEDSIKVRERACMWKCTGTCVSAPHQCWKSLIKGFKAFWVRVGMPRVGGRWLDISFISFHTHKKRENGSFDLQHSCRVWLRWQSWRTFQRIGHLWTPAPLNIFKCRTTHSPFPTFPPLWLVWHKIAATAFAFLTLCFRFGLGNVS